MQKDNLEILLEDIRGKFDLVLEGHEVLRKEIQDTREELCEKIKFLDFKVDAIHDKLDRKVDSVEGRLGSKIDAVAADLAAHRRDTEAHPPLYKVKEGN